MSFRIKSPPLQAPKAFRSVAPVHLSSLPSHHLALRTRPPPPSQSLFYLWPLLTSPPLPRRLFQSHLPGDSLWRPCKEVPWAWVRASPCALVPQAPTSHSLTVCMVPLCHLSAPYLRAKELSPWGWCPRWMLGGDISYYYYYYYFWQWFIKSVTLPRNLLGGPVVKNTPPNAGHAGSIPGWRTKIPHAMQHN